mmetsp:Transcript_70565/g.163082  ORF Transcript_70565/g.163082 Transcript_70565/m.163082 type:complete len:368 (+) Transcript_70565:138-1241(+)
MASMTLQRLREAVREVVKGQRFQEAVGPGRAAECALRASHAGRVLEDELLKALNAQPDKRELGPQLGALLDSGRFADVVVRVGQEEISAHSAILAARSPVFEAMWSSGMREQQQKEVVIKDLDPAAVRRMLRFMYTGALDTKLEKDSDAIALLEVAHQYDVASLVELCVSTLSSWLTEDKAAEYLMIAEHAGLESFRRRCLDFITSSHSRVAEVQTTEAFARLAEKRPHLAVEILAKAIPPSKRARTASRTSADSLPGTQNTSAGGSSSSSNVAQPPAGPPLLTPAGWLQPPAGPPPPPAGPAAAAWATYPSHPPTWRPTLLGARPPPVPVTASWPLSAPSLMPPPASPTAGGATPGGAFPALFNIG